jgi:hypothetical protein
MTLYQEYRWLRRLEIDPLMAFYIVARRAWFQYRCRKLTKKYGSLRERGLE